MPFRAQPPSLDPVDQPSLPPDGLVQLLVLTLLNQVRENPQHASCAAIESQLRDRQVSLAASAGEDAGPLIDPPKSSQRKSVGYGGGS